MRRLSFLFILVVSTSFSFLNGQDNSDKANALCEALLNQDKERAKKLSQNINIIEELDTLKKIAKKLAQRYLEQINVEDSQLFLFELSEKVDLNEIKKNALEAKELIFLCKECGLIQGKKQFNDINIILGDLDKLIASLEKMPELDGTNDLDPSLKSDVVNVVRNGLSILMKVNSFIINHVLKTQKDKPNLKAFIGLNDLIYLLDGGAIFANPSTGWFTRSVSVVKRIPALIRVLFLIEQLEELKEKQEEVS